jgi:hypothetical protein
MKYVAVAVVALVAASVPASVMARPYVPHHTSAGMAHRHNGVSHHHHHRGMKADRMQRRANTHHFGNPNSRNPSQEGYQQQLGNTTNGPRY